MSNDEETFITEQEAVEILLSNLPPDAPTLAQAMIMGAQALKSKLRDEQWLLEQYGEMFGLLNP